MIDSIINIQNINDADAVLVEVPYEHTTSSRKGTVNGPKAVMNMLNDKLELFDRTYEMQPIDKIKIGNQNLENINTMNPEEALAEITNQCAKLVNQDKFVVLLGGEHSVALGLLQALSKKIDPKEVTILQIDAHCDLRDDDSDYHDNPSKFAHSCVLRRAHELGFNLVQVGVRTYSIVEYNYFSDPKNNIKVWQWGNGNKIPSVDEVINSIKTKYVYITIDVDGFDPAHMPGTGTTVQGGLDWWYGVDLIEKVVDSKELVGADIVEVSPMTDSVLTEYGAAQLAYTIITHKFKNKLL